MFSVRSTAGTGPTSLSTVEDKPENLVMKVAGDSFAKSTNDRYFDESNNLFAVTNTSSSQGTFSPFSPYWSYKFDGNGDYLTTATSANLLLNSNADWTIELWLNPAVTPAAASCLLFSSNGSGGGWNVSHNTAFYIDSSRRLVVEWSTGSVTPQFTTGTNTVPLNSWSHIAFVYNGSAKTITTYVNGVIDINAASMSSYAPPAAAPRTTISRTDPTVPAPTEYFLQGLVSNLRIVNGSSVYTSSFTPSTSPFTAVANTSLLTLQNPYLKDNSTNNFALTVNGDVAATSFSPFKVVKQENWSYDFDGSTDYITVADNDAFNFRNDNFAVEFWFNPRAVDTSWIVSQFESGGGDDTNSAFTFLFTAANKLQAIVAHNNSTSQVNLVSTTTITSNLWYHAALVRNGTSLTLYLNGKAEATSTAISTNVVNNSNLSLSIGRRTGGSNYFNGYISNLRIVKGSAVYTTAFTPETTKTRLIGGTVFLSLQDKVLQDNGPYSLTVTKNGTPTTSSTNPFSGSTEGVNWSWYFSGNNNYLSIPYSSTLDMNSGSFTFECWIYATNISGIEGIYGTSGGPGAVPKFVVHLNAGVPSIHYNGLTNGADIYTTASSAVSANEWTHIAFVRNSTTWTWYINGVASGTGSNDTVITFTNQATYLGYGGEAYFTPFNGYISNLRVVKGSAVYTAAFTPSTSNLSAVAGTSLLALQNSTIVDNSTNAHSISTTGTVLPFNGNAFFSTGEKTTLPAHSVYFDGTGDYLTVADNTALDMEAASFTIECWFYPLTTPNSQTLFSKRASNAAFGGVQVGFGANTLFPSLLATVNGTSWSINIASTVAVALNSWNHIAAVRNGGGWQLYVNGVSGVSTTLGGTVPNNTAAFAIGAGAADGSTAINSSYISNFRVIKGVAVYTANFVPPVAPLDVTLVPSTVSLLTCQGTEIADGSPNNFTVTANGNAAVRKVSPFPLRETDIQVGSGLFAASNTDYLSVAGSSAFAITTSTTPFTIEAWVYPTASGGAIFSDQFTTGTNTVPITLSLSNGTGANNTTGLIPALGYYNGTSWVTAAVSTTAISLNQWNHVAAVFTGSTTKIFINGVDVTAGSPTPATTWGVTGANGDNWYIGRRWDNNATEYFSGHISNLRFVRGTAVYTAAFTPPTTPVGKIANTSLLLNFSSPGVFDTTGNSVLRKVGNAAASYLPSSGAYPKTGKTAIFFDGTGDYFGTQNANTAFGTGDFTVEFWHYPTISNSLYTFIDWRPSETNGQYVSLHRNASNQIVFVVNTTQGITGTTACTAGAWYHIALSRISGTTRLFVNGNLQGIYADTNNYTTPALRPLIGENSFATGTELTGVLDDIKVHRGYGKYSSNFYVSRVATPISAMVATGGTETTADGYKIHSFTSNGTLIVTSPGEFEYLLVGGGGGGGGGGLNVGGGGGGAGGFLQGTATITQTGALNINVGTGGAGGNPGAKGVDSLISSSEISIRAVGGAGGSNSNVTYATGGGSGGGVAGSGTAGTGISGPPRQGNSGATGVGTYGTTFCSGGGGGGAGANGSTGPGQGTGGSGGNGRISRINGTATTYSTGGNGAGANTGVGASGAANTGNGGGGGGGNAVAAGNGGSGIVIIRYKL